MGDVREISNNRRRHRFLKPWSPSGYDNEIHGRADYDQDELGSGSHNPDDPVVTQVNEDGVDRRPGSSLARASTTVNDEHPDAALAKQAKRPREKAIARNTSSEGRAADSAANSKRTLTDDASDQIGRDLRVTPPPSLDGKRGGNRKVASAPDHPDAGLNPKKRPSSPHIPELGLSGYYDAADEDDDAPVRNKRPEDEFVGSELQSRQRDNKRGVFVPDWILRLTSNGDERLVLAQIAYWFGSSSPNGRPRAKIRNEGYYWLAKTYLKLGHEVKLSQRQTRYTLDKLRKKGFIDSEVHLFSGRRANHIRLKLDVILERLQIGPGATEYVGIDDEVY